MCSVFVTRFVSTTRLVKQFNTIQGEASPVASAETESLPRQNLQKNHQKPNHHLEKINNFSKIPLSLALNSSKFHHIFSSNDINTVSQYANHSFHSMWCPCSIISINRTSAHHVSLSIICCPAPHIICLILIQPAAFGSIIKCLPAVSCIWAAFSP